MFYDVFPDVT